jgi:hypothetical protein
VAADDLRLFRIVDDPSEVVPFIREVISNRRLKEPRAEPHVRQAKGDAQ